MIGKVSQLCMSSQLALVPKSPMAPGGSGQGGAVRQDRRKVYTNARMSSCRAERMVVGHDRLTEQCLGHPRPKPFGHGNTLLCRSQRASANQHGDFLTCVEDAGWSRISLTGPIESPLPRER